MANETGGQEAKGVNNSTQMVKGKMLMEIFGKNGLNFGNVYYNLCNAYKITHPDQKEAPITAATVRNFINGANSPDKKSISIYVEAICNAYQDIKFTEEFFNGSLSDFAAPFEGTTYKDLHGRLLNLIDSGDDPLQSIWTDQIRPLIGDYLAIYLCRDKIDTKNNAVAIEIVRFSRSSVGHILKVTRPYYQHGRYEPVGTARCKMNIIEINIDFFTKNEPNSFYLARRPDGTKIDCFIALNLDITAISHSIAGRPMIFVSKEKIPDDIYGTYGSNSPIYDVAKEFIDKYISFNMDRFEVRMKPQIDEEDIDKIRQALEETSSASFNQKGRP